MAAVLPWLLWSESPTCFVRANFDRSRDVALWSDHSQHALQQGVVHRPAKVDAERRARLRYRYCNLPGLRIRRLSHRRPAAKRLPKALDHRGAIGVAPLPIDQQRVLFAIGNWRPHRAIRREIAFDASRVERHRQPAIRRVPELLTGKKDASQDLSCRIEHMNPLLGFAAAHWRGEIDVETQLIAGQHVN